MNSHPGQRGEAERDPGSRRGEEYDVGVLTGRTHTKRASYIGLVVVLTIGTALGAAQYGWWRFMTIATHQASAKGIVLRTNCRNNNDVSYSFSVGGHSLEGRDNWIDCRSLTAGDQLPISYASSDPSQNMAGDAYGRFVSETIAILLASILGSFVVVFVFVNPLRKQKT